MSTATAYRNRILDYADQTGREIGKGKAMKLAIILHRRGERMHDLDMERIFMHADIVPPSAFQHVERGYCRHCEPTR